MNPFRKRQFWFAKFYMIEFTANASVVELFFCRDLTCIVYFNRNAYVRMTIYSSLNSFLHNELLSNKFETPDVRLDVQLPLLRYYISWGWGNVNANF